MNERKQVHWIRGRLGTASSGSQDVVVLVSYDAIDSSQLEVELVLMPGTSSKAADALGYGIRAIEIENIDDPIRPLGIPHMTGLMRNPMNGHVRIDATEIRLGMLSNPLGSPCKYHLIARLSPQGILAVPKVSTRHPSGAIEVDPFEKGDIRFSAQQGSWQLAENYSYFSSSTADGSMTTMVQGAIAVAEIDLAGISSIRELHTYVEEDTLRVCSLLSLCNRCPVLAFQYEYYPDSDPRRQLPRGLVRLRKSSPHHTGRREELVNFRGLVDGGFDALYAGFANHKLQRDLSRAISFVAGSYSSEVLEVSYFLAFAALDLLVQGLGERSGPVICDAQWNRIQNAVEPVLVQAASQAGVDRETVDLMRNRLYGIPRPKHVKMGEQIARLVKSKSLVVHDLWPGLGFESGVTRATKARHDLFHQARVDNPGAMYGDRIRVATLAERLIIHELGFPEERLWHWRDQQLQWLTQD